MRTGLIPFTSLLLVAQAAPTPWAERAARLHPAVSMPDAAVFARAAEGRRSLEAGSPLAALPFRCVGPMGQGGRVVALAADPRRPEVWLAAFATGGLWITRTDGSTWEPLFDREEAFALGDVAVHWAEPGVPKTIWVGTGEPNASRSSYAGTGVFRSDDGGRTWRHLGLRGSHRIARIVLHPKDPDTVYVAAQGPLYTEGGERGVYRTRDGGRSWTCVLSGGRRAGATDLLMDWNDPSTLYAALWEKDRKPWDFLECGPGSGVHRSTDGGATWTRLQGGLPGGELVGRIGLAQSRQDPNKLFAFVDNHTPRGKDERDPFEDPERLTAKQLAGMEVADLLKLEPKRLKAFLKDHGFRKDLTVDLVRDRLKAGTLAPKDLVDYLGDADAALVETDIIGPELYATTDRGTTWKRTHDRRINDFTYTYGYYFGQVRVDPSDDRRLYLLGMPLIGSSDGGRTFKGLNGESGANWEGVHADHHDLWIDPRNPQRLVLGNDGGLNISMDAGSTWRAVKNLPVAQCYTVAVDQAEPYRIYTGLQDNGVMMGPAQPLRPGQQKDGWSFIWGGDGGFVQVSPKDNITVFTESQFGHMGRLNTRSRERTSIRPAQGLKEPPYRFNWMTPLLLSPHSPEILYTGTQQVLRSFDRGDTWTAISPDLTATGVHAGAPTPEPLRPSQAMPAPGLTATPVPADVRRGNVPFATITTIAESPKRFGLMYAGTDDGRVWASRDGGFSWKEGGGLPTSRWVVRVEASRHAEGRAYAAFSALRDDTAEALVYRSEDYGQSWVPIQGNLPAENLNTLREDPVNPDLLYAGTDLGLFASLDGGKRWDALTGGLPHVPVHDVAVHPKTGDLVAATHGRSVWVAPARVLQGYSAKIRESDQHLFEVPKQKAQPWWKTDRPTWFTAREVEPVPLWFHLKTAGPVTLRLKDDKGKVLRNWTLAGTAGLNRADWDLQVDRTALPTLPEGRRAFVPAGKFSLELEASGRKASRTVEVEAAKEAGPEE